MDRTELSEFGMRYAKAWCSRDPEKVAAFYAEDGTLSVNDGPPAVGRQGIADVARGFMSAFLDMRVAMDDVVRESHGTAFHWTLTGTNSGHDLWHLDNNGLIGHSKGHFDSDEYERQLRDGVDG